MSNIQKTIDNAVVIIDDSIINGTKIPITLYSYVGARISEVKSLLDTKATDNTINILCTADYYGGTLDNKYVSKLRYFLMSNKNIDATKYYDIYRHLRKLSSFYKLTLCFEFSRDFEWNPGDFGDHKSCYFGGRAGAIRIIEKHNGFAVKIYKKLGIDYVPFGRMWGVLHNKRLVFWNGYSNYKSELSSFMPNTNYHYIYSLFLAKYFRLYMKYINLENNDRTTGTLYINSGGIVLTDDTKILKRNSLDFGWGDIQLYHCHSCNGIVWNDSELVSDSYGNLYCEECADANLAMCNYNLLLYDKNDMVIGPDEKQYYRYNIDYVNDFVKMYDGNYAYKSECKLLSHRYNLWVKKFSRKKLCPNCNVLVISSKEKMCNNCKKNLDVQKELSTKFRTIKFEVTNG